jgi:hypothetical protein
MATGCPPQVASARTSHQELQPEHPLPHEGIAATLLGRVGQLLCGIHGHEPLMQFDRDRLYLKCISCGHESPGWLLPTDRRPVGRLEPVRRPVLPVAARFAAVAKAPRGVRRVA